MYLYLYKCTTYYIKSWGWESILKIRVYARYGLRESDWMIRRTSESYAAARVMKISSNRVARLAGVHSRQTSMQVQSV